MGVALFITLVFAVVSSATSIWAIWCVWRSQIARFKLVWMAGCLVGFFGFKTGLSVPTDLYGAIGIKVPIVIAGHTASNILILEAMFPVIAVIALVKFGGTQQLGNGS